ncbi:hypothetical protein EON80_07400 [bacterium]|nr:MAG: hypothetical protein EON80_07400 [bacterium]
MLVAPGDRLAGDLNGPVAAETPFAKITAQLGRPPLPKNVEGKLNPALALSLYLDPQLKIDSGSFSIDYAEYSAGKPVFSFPQREAFGPGFTGTQLISKFNVMLPKTAKIGTKISRLGGVVRAYVITVTQTLKVEDLLKAAGTASQVGNVDFKVTGATVEGRLLKVKLAAERPELESQFSNPAVAFGGAHVRDAQGHLLRAMPTNLQVFKAVQGREKLEGEISFRLSDGQGPFSLEWTLPTRTRRLEIPFELKDLVLR